jgi:hydroxyacylglutathione hydrolase
MKRLNALGPPLLGFAQGYSAVPEIDLSSGAKAVREGAVPIDLCDDDSVCGEHIAASLRMAFGPRIGYWAGWVLPENARIVLLTDSGARAAEAGRQLFRVGFDRIEGYVAAPGSAWRDLGFPLLSITQISVEQLREQLMKFGRLTLVDVRSDREWNDGHIAEAIHVPIGEMSGRAADFDRQKPIATICEGGYRSMLAASILARAGFPRVLNVSGGMTAYRDGPTP